MLIKKLSCWYETHHVLYFILIQLKKGKSQPLLFFVKVLFEKDVLQVCNKFTGEHPCQGVISIKIKISCKHYPKWSAYNCPSKYKRHVDRTCFHDSLKSQCFSYERTLTGLSWNQPKLENIEILYLLSELKGWISTFCWHIY